MTEGDMTEGDRAEGDSTADDVTARDVSAAEPGSGASGGPQATGPGRRRRPWWVWAWAGLMVLQIVGGLPALGDEIAAATPVAVPFVLAFDLVPPVLLAMGFWTGHPLARQAVVALTVLVMLGTGVTLVGGKGSGPVLLMSLFWGVLVFTLVFRGLRGEAVRRYFSMACPRCDSLKVRSRK